MGNCLVTKLKSTVDNNLLLKLGEFRIDFEGTGEANQSLEDLMSSSADQVVLRALEGEFVDANLQPYSPSVKERTIVSGRNLDIRVSPNAKIAIGPKSTIIRLITPTGSNCTIDLDSLYLSEGADEVNIRGANAYGSVDNLPKNLARFEFSGPSVYGHLASLLSQSQRINRFQIYGVNIEGTTAIINDIAHPELMQRVLIVSCPKITGTLRDFGKMSILSALTLGDRNQTSATPISGTVEDFATDQADPNIGNRTSGGVSVISNGIITYQGNAVAAGHYINITYNPSLPNGYSVEIL